MKRLLRYARARLRPAKPLPPVTVPAPVGPARIATPAEQEWLDAVNARAAALKIRQLTFDPLTYLDAKRAYQEADRRVAAAEKALGL